MSDGRMSAHDPLNARPSLWKFLGRRVDPDRQEVVKFLPSNPPERGDFVLVDGVRSRVTRCKVTWNGPHWTILSLRVKTASAVLA